MGQFKSLFKDTSLVYIIGMLDVVAISRAFIQGNPEFLASAKELFIFLALVFWVFALTLFADSVTSIAIRARLRSRINQQLPPEHMPSTSKTS